MEARQPERKKPALSIMQLLNRGVVKMRKTLLAVMITGLLWSSDSAWAQIALVHVTPCGSGLFPATTCTIPATGAGHLIVIAWGSNNGGGASTISSITDNASGGGNVYVQAPGARSVETTTNYNMDLWYAKNSQSGATTMTVTPSPSGTSGAAVIWEFSGVDTVSPLDQTAARNSQAATTSPAGAPVTITSPNEVIVDVAIVQSVASGIHSGNLFINDATLNGNGWSHLLTSSIGTYAAQWDSDSGRYCASTASFKAASSSSSWNSCDLSADLTVNVVDVQWAVNMVLGMMPCTANINGTGVCDVVVVQRVINAALGGTCITDTSSSSHSVSLTWTASTSSSVIGYNLYRGTTSGGSYTKLNSSLVTTTNYTDTTVVAGQTYYYVASAVDSSAESAYSNQAQAVVPSP
jgi:hypothetical protein